MRVNIYAEEMTDRIEIIEKTIDGQIFEACRFYLYLPTSYTPTPFGPKTDLPNPTCEIKGPFIHRDGDDDSAAITFWSRGKLRDILQKAIDLLDEHHRKHYNKNPSGVECIDIVRHMNFNRGNAMKYIWRAGEKGNEIEDLKKAQWYINDEIKRLENVKQE